MRSITARVGVAVAVVASIAGVTVPSAGQAATYYNNTNRNVGGGTWWHEWPCNVVVSMPLSFRDKASSWQNAGTEAEALDYTGSGTWYDIQWYMAPNSYSNYVGAANDNQVDAHNNIC